MKLRSIPTTLFEILRKTHSLIVCCCLQTYYFNFNLELILGQNWMVVLINGRILFCPPIIMYCEICCCLHIHLVVNMLVMGLVLGQRLMLISSTGILLYAKVCPLYNVLWECIVVVYTLTTLFTNI